MVREGLGWKQEPYCGEAQGPLYGEDFTRKVRERTWTRLRPAREHSKTTTTDVESGWGFSDKTKAVVLGMQKRGGSLEMPSK